MDQAVDLITKARAGNPRLWFIHLRLAGALGFKGDLDEAKAALAEAIRLKPDINSLKKLRNYRRFENNPMYRTLAETTLYVGLRKAGMPEE